MNDSEYLACVEIFCQARGRGRYCGQYGGSPLGDGSRRHSQPKLSIVQACRNLATTSNKLVSLYFLHFENRYNLLKQLVTTCCSMETKQ